MNNYEKRKKLLKRHQTDNNKKKTCAKATVKVDLSSENVGFKAGDVYNALAAENKGLVSEIAKAVKITVEETLSG